MEECKIEMNFYMRIGDINVGNTFNNSYKPGCVGLFDNIFHKAVKKEEHLYGLPICR